MDWEIEYWSEMLLKADKELEPLRHKLYDAPTPELTFEERWTLREVLTNVSSYTRLLAKDVAAMKVKNKKPKRFWRR